jgi:hypothetical protein
LNADDVASLMHVNPSALELASPHQPEQRFSNPCGGKLAACPNDKEPIMAMVFELLTLLSALALLPRYSLGYPAGWIADHGGWYTYYVASFVIALPGLALVWWKRRHIEALDHARAAMAA